MLPMISLWCSFALILIVTVASIQSTAQAEGRLSDLAGRGHRPLKRLSPEASLPSTYSKRSSPGDEEAPAAPMMLLPRRSLKQVLESISVDKSNGGGLEQDDDDEDEESGSLQTSYNAFVQSLDSDQDSSGVDSSGSSTYSAFTQSRSTSSSANSNELSNEPIADSRILEPDSGPRVREEEFPADIKATQSDSSGKTGSSSTSTLEQQDNFGVLEANPAEQSEGQSDSPAPANRQSNSPFGELLSESGEQGDEDFIGKNTTQQGEKDSGDQSGYTPGEEGSDKDAGTGLPRQDSPKKKMGDSSQSLTDASGSHTKSSTGTNDAESYESPHRHQEQDSDRSGDRGGEGDLKHDRSSTSSTSSSGKDNSDSKESHGSEEAGGTKAEQEGPEQSTEGSSSPTSTPESGKAPNSTSNSPSTDQSRTATSKAQQTGLSSKDAQESSAGDSDPSSSDSEEQGGLRGSKTPSNTEDRPKDGSDGYQPAKSQSPTDKSKIDSDPGQSPPSSNSTTSAGSSATTAPTGKSDDQNENDNDTGLRGSKNDNSTGLLGSQAASQTESASFPSSATAQSGQTSSTTAYGSLTGSTLTSQAKAATTQTGTPYVGGSSSSWVPQSSESADNITSILPKKSHASGSSQQYQPAQIQSSSSDDKSAAFGYADRHKLILPQGGQNENLKPGVSETNTTPSEVAPGSDKPTRDEGAKASDNLSSVPTVIVPKGAPSTQPVDTTMIAILFTSLLSWSFLASSSDTVAQIFLYMPSLLAEVSSRGSPFPLDILPLTARLQAVGLDSSAVSTIGLQSYALPSPLGLSRRQETNKSKPLSLYLAYVPSQVAPQMQEMVRNQSSAFYIKPTNSVAVALASNIDPNYDILKMQSVVRPDRDAAQRGSEAGSSDTALRNALIGVGASLAACILVFVAWRVWKNNRKQSRRNAAQGMMAGGIGQRGTILSFGTGTNSLRETWTPSVQEQERVLHGQLTETWEHNDQGSHRHTVGAMPRHGPEMGFAREVAAASLSHGQWSPVEDPFQDAVSNQGSQETERSDRGLPLRNTLLSHLNSFDNRSGGSLASGLTEAQRIQLDYFDATSSPKKAEESESQPHIPYQDVYDRPQQYTSSHAFGPRAAANRSKRRASKDVFSPSVIPDKSTFI